MELNLTRPLLFFDIESTGLSIPADSIVELSFVKIFPGGEQRTKTWRIKPWDYVAQKQRHISEEASGINGITDKMVAGCPRFCEIVDEVVEWLRDSDLAGYNSSRFDLPMLAEEIERVKLYCKKDIDINLHEPLMVDVLNIYHAMEPRNLKAAYRFYCGGADFENAHSAEADTIATYEVLKGQLDMYSEAAGSEKRLKNDVKFLSTYVAKKNVDFSGQLIFNDKGEPVLNFGKHKGKTLRQVYNTDRSYFSWVQNGSFSLDTKAQFAKYEDEYNRERLAAKFNGGKLF